MASPSPISYLWSQHVPREEDKNRGRAEHCFPKYSAHLHQSVEGRGGIQY